MLNGTPGQRKALLKELVVEVRVESRDSIVPTFRLPTAPVRVTEAVVDPRSHNTNPAETFEGSGFCWTRSLLGHLESLLGDSDTCA
jgi:hypothetical protein